MIEIKKAGLGDMLMSAAKPFTAPFTSPAEATVQAEKIKNDEGTAEGLAFAGKAALGTALAAGGLATLVHLWKKQELGRKKRDLGLIGISKVAGELPVLPPIGRAGSPLNPDTLPAWAIPAASGGAIILGTLAAYGLKKYLGKRNTNDSKQRLNNEIAGHSKVLGDTLAQQGFQVRDIKVAAGFFDDARNTYGLYAGVTGGAAFLAAAYAGLTKALNNPSKAKLKQMEQADMYQSMISPEPLRLVPLPATK